MTFPPATSQVRSQTSSRNHRSCVTTTNVLRRAPVPAEPADASTSRWLVGSSSTSRSCVPRRSAASATRRRSPPDSCSARRRGRCRRAVPRAARAPARPAPTRARAASPKTSSRTWPVELLGLRQVADPQAPRLWSTGPSPGRRPRPAPRAASSCPRRCGRPRRSGHRRRCPSRRWSSSTARAVRLGRRLEVDQIHAGSAVPPGSRPGPGRHLDHRPAHAGPGERDGQVTGRVGVAGEERTGRAGAGDDRPERAVLVAGGQCPAQQRRSESAAGCRSLRQQRADRRRVTGPQRGHQLGVQVGILGTGPAPPPDRAARSRSQAA